MPESGLRLDEKLKALTALSQACTRQSVCGGPGVGHVALLVFVFQHWADSTIWRMRLSDPS